MRSKGLKSIVLAAGLAIAGIGHAAAPAPQTVAPTTTAATPADAAKPVAATPTDPMLAMDGAPAMLPTPGIGMPVDKGIALQPQVTANGRRALWFHNAILLPVITIISLFVLGLLLWVMARYRRAANPVPSKTSHNTLIEIIWTAVPVIILALIAAPSIGLLAAQYKPAPANAVTLKAIGNQWFWSYQYPDNGGFEITSNMLKEKDQVTGGDRARTDADGPELLATDNRVVLPVGVPIRLLTTSNDVIHSWSIPAFWIKLDAVPGRINETSFTIEKPGVYFGVCSELCGARHGFMPITVEAVEPAVFAAWVKAKGGTMPGAGKPSTTAADSDSTAPAATDANTTGPVENATSAAPATNQAATGNPAGAGNAGQ
ncbi:MAG: cytochrome oxidase subunit [Sphingomonas bacterium]|uniref:cytochrome c oxidase subunit II n=1 Tax=Sphingomonas bacterium TaxID=1895847 RepID=UPI002621E8ED|nr:cytochrome c oxidase subunit II [Sphingomonas bacterium]MDB5706571.1 cytochrome oxidase subunit [Sphingomonas bacterium]